MDLKCIIFGMILVLKNVFVECMNTQVSHFEYLNYDIYNLQEQHERVRRSTSTRGKQPVNLEFASHGRHFKLRLVRDTSLFHPDAVIETTSDGEVHHSNITHLYHGSLLDVKGSSVHGSIINGIFRGVINDPYRGSYYVEENMLFFGGKRGQSPANGYLGHSVMYHQDAVKLPEKYKTTSHCGISKSDIIQRMQNFQQANYDSKQGENPRELKRRKRQIDPNRNTCLLFLQSDWVLYEAYENTELIISKLAEHVKAADTIYRRTRFVAGNGDAFPGIRFKVLRIRVNNTDTRNDQYNPFRNRNIGVERFLDITSLERHDAYCLAYVFTNRDFDNGVLGLAWVATPSGPGGGICERHRVYSDGTGKSLNTGIVTFTNYGSMVPSRVSHITFAHELGHNFGSPHDSGVACTPGDNRLGGFGTNGNFIMYARATSGTDPNNDQFSECSIRNISAVLEAKIDRCFVPSDQPICGNQLVEEDEECDCGFEEDCLEVGDQCCTPAVAGDENAGCKLKPESVCSISQGSCCERNCRYSPATKICEVGGECRYNQTCTGDTGESAICPTAEARPNTTQCMKNTSVCINGECSGSICLTKDQLDPCECTAPEGSSAEERSTLCHTCCRVKNTTECKSTGELPEYFNDTIFLQPGSACDDFNGYCDVFSNCRLVDADGPLSRLKQAIFNPELYSNIKKWIIDYWWAVLLMSIALILLMVGFIKVCSVHTPTHNPRLPKHKQFPGAATLQRRRTRHRPQQGGAGPSRHNQHEMRRYK